MHMTIALNQRWFCLFTLQILLAMMLMSSNMESVCANADYPEIPIVSDNENEFMMEREANFDADILNDKRDWNAYGIDNLKSMLGKRAGPRTTTKSWNNLAPSWGRR